LRLIHAPDDSTSDASGIEPPIIQPQETTFQILLHRLLPSPQANRRFDEVYRHIKSGIPVGERPDFENGPYQVPMLLLAILVGAPAAAERLFPALRCAAETHGDIGLVLRTFTPVDRTMTALARVEHAVRPVIADPDFPASPELLRRWLRCVVSAFFLAASHPPRWARTTIRPRLVPVGRMAHQRGASASTEAEPAGSEGHDLEEPSGH
jgi:hypothetical protein